MLRINCRSFTRSSKLPRSTTSNQVPLPTVNSASITQASAPWVTALLRLAKLSLGARCPVRSENPYTPMVITGPSSTGTDDKSCARGFGCSLGSLYIALGTSRTVLQPTNNIVNDSASILIKS